MQEIIMYMSNMFTYNDVHITLFLLLKMTQAVVSAGQNGGIEVVNSH